MRARPDPLIVRLRARVKRHGLWAPADRLLVSVSGGLDSVVLLHALRFGFENPLLVAHIDHGLRPDSGQDAAFTEALCRAWDVPCYVRRLQIPEELSRAQGVEAAARRLRYAALEEMADALGARWILTAHHLRDQAETVLLNLLRGSGLWGLRGIARRSGRLLRPLLDFDRAEIRAYAERHGLAWREDPTNRDVRFRRNALRERLWPVLEEFFGPRPERTLGRFAELVHELLADLEPTWDRLLEEATAERRGKSWALEIPRLMRYLASARRAVLHRALKALGAPAEAEGVARLLELLNRPTGRSVVLRGGWRAWRDRDRLWIGLEEPEAGLAVEIVPGQAEVQLPDGRLRIRPLPRPPAEWPRDPRRAYVDREALSYPLRLRRWRAGDRFRPLGMRGNKKLSDFLTDLRLSGPARSRVWVLESAGQIAWVVGWRIDDRFRVRDRDRPCIELVWEPHGAPSEDGASASEADLV
ncbi:MAG: tRNA lysidine(34) synthetase TilS [Bacteroidota bacterium]|nr:tRNA lysidine(34) synthetase TilS [Rhodothermia bacterium]MDW8284808.1 tRNA lysidine(34) synthetase TilS [Bacteroidota bacterium]